MDETILEILFSKGTLALELFNPMSKQLIMDTGSVFTFCLRHHVGIPHVLNMVVHSSKGHMQK